MATSPPTFSLPRHRVYSQRASNSRQWCRLLSSHFLHKHSRSLLWVPSCTTAAWGDKQRPQLRPAYTLSQRELRLKKQSEVQPEAWAGLGLSPQLRGGRGGGKGRGGGGKGGGGGKWDGGWGGRGRARGGEVGGWGVVFALCLCPASLGLFSANWIPIGIHPGNLASQPWSLSQSPCF